MRPTLIILLLMVCGINFGQSKKGALTDIKNKYQLIRELLDSNALRQHHTDYSCKENSENGTLTFYYNGNELKHIVHSHIKGHVKYRDEFYIWDDQLFFQYAVHNVWYKDYERSSSGKLKMVDVTLTLEERFYFKDEQVIKCQFKDFENRSNNPKQVKTRNVRNKNVGCEEAQKAIEKFNLFMQYQNTNIENACNLPRSIMTFEPLDFLYNKNR